MILYRDNAASVQPPPAVGGNILIKGIMLYVYSFAIVRLSVLTRPNPDMSRSRARGRSDSAHECRRRIKIVDFKGVIAKRSVPDSCIRRYTQPTRRACNTTCQPAFSRVAEPEQGTLRSGGEVEAARHGRITLFLRCEPSLPSWRRRNRARECPPLAFERGHFTSPRLLLRQTPQSSDRLRHAEKNRFAHDGNRCDKRHPMLDDRHSSHEAS